MYFNSIIWWNQMIINKSIIIASLLLYNAF